MHKWKVKRQYRSSRREDRTNQISSLISPGAILGFSQWRCSLRAAKFKPRPLPGQRPFCRQRPLFSRWCTVLTVCTTVASIPSRWKRRKGLESRLVQQYSAISKSRMFMTRSSIRLGWQTLANSSNISNISISIYQYVKCQCNHV